MKSRFSKLEIMFELCLILMTAVMNKGDLDED